MLIFSGQDVALSYITKREANLPENFTLDLEKPELLDYAPDLDTIAIRYVCDIETENKPAPAHVGKTNFCIEDKHRLGNNTIRRKSILTETLETESLQNEKVKKKQIKDDRDRSEKEMYKRRKNRKERRR